MFLFHSIFVVQLVIILQRTSKLTLNKVLSRNQYKRHMNTNVKIDCIDSKSVSIKRFGTGL